MNNNESLAMEIAALERSMQNSLEQVRSMEQVAQAANQWLRQRERQWDTLAAGPPERRSSSLQDDLNRIEVGQQQWADDLEVSHLINRPVSLTPR